MPHGNSKFWNHSGQRLVLMLTYVIVLFDIFRACLDELNKIPSNFVWDGNPLGFTFVPLEGTL